MLGPRSMTGRLVAGLFAGTILVLSTMGLFMYGEVEDIVIASVDRTLHSKLQMLTGLLHEEYGRVELELSEIIAGEYVIPRSGHYYRVISGKNTIAFSPSLVDSDYRFVEGSFNGPLGFITGSGGNEGEHLYTALGPDNEPVRVLHSRLSAFEQTFDITLAESIDGSLMMIATFRRFLLIAVPLASFVLGLVGWSIAKASLRPLKGFSSAIAAITHKNLKDRIDHTTTVRELDALARSFNALLDRLTNVFESQKRLVADASHELKTPLALIKTQCDVVLQRPRTPEEYAEALQTVRSVSQDMTRLAGDLLSLARLDAGLVSDKNFVPCSVSDCIERALAVIGGFASARGIRISHFFDEDVIVNGVCTALTDAFVNLLENAVKYNRDQGSIDVTAKRRDKEVVITISDTGSGIKEDDRNRIFERFYRAPTARNTGGTGLGLSIVRSIIELHGGSVAVDSEPGSFSRFTLIFPAYEEDQAVPE
jgi:heavy metal sensor kinase